MCVNNPSECNFAIFRDAFSYMRKTSIYRAAADAQSRRNNDFGHNVDALVTGRSSTNVSTHLSVLIIVLRMLQLTCVWESTCSLMNRKMI